MPKLQISDDTEQYVYEIFDDEVSLGRGAANAVQVADSHASKHHAVLRRIRTHWKLVDLESSNGTKVNGEFRNQHWLFDGDEIAIGTSVLRYDAEGAPDGPPEVADAGVVRPKAVPAKPVGVPAVAAKPRPVAVKPQPVMAAPQVLEEAPVEAEPQVMPVEPARPSRARAGAPARRSRARAEDDYYEDEDGRPRREPRKNNSALIGLGIGAGCVVFAIAIFMIFDLTESHNKQVLFEGMRMARNGDHAQALAYAEQNGRPNGLDYEKLQTGMQSWKLRVDSDAQLERNQAAQKYWTYEIQRKAYSERRNRDGSIGNTTRPVGALGDEEIVIRIRQFLKENWETPVVRTFLGSENDVFPYFRDLLRQHADESYTAGRAWAEIQDDVTAFSSRLEWGRAVQRLKRHGQIGRLTMLPEAWKKLQSQIDNEVASVEDRAASDLADELKRVEELMAEEERDTATQLVRILVNRFNGIPHLSDQVREVREKHQLKQ